MPDRRTRRQQPTQLSDEQRAAQTKALEARASMLLKAADDAEADAIGDPTPPKQAIAKQARASAEACGAMLTSAPKPTRKRGS